jgi:hypothetical protein
MTYRKGIWQLTAGNVSNPLAKAQRVWYNADTMLDTIFLRNQRNERKNRVKMDCLVLYGANNAERQKSGNNLQSIKSLDLQGFLSLPFVLIQTVIQETPQKCGVSFRCV